MREVEPVTTLATEREVVESRRPAVSGGRHIRELLAADFDRLHKQVYRYLLHRFFDAELAEELTAQTFYKVAASLGQIRGNAAQLRVWLLRTATNLANTHYRRKRLRRLFLLRFAQQTPTTTEPERASDSTTGQRLARVRGVLLALRPKYQTVVVLRYYTDMSVGEIAAVLGCCEDAVRARLSRAIREMRDRLGLRELVGPARSQ